MPTDPIPSADTIEREMLAELANHLGDVPIPLPARLVIRRGAEAIAAIERRTADALAIPSPGHGIPLTADPRAERAALPSSVPVHLMSKDVLLQTVPLCRTTRMFGDWTLDRARVTCPDCIALLPPATSVSPPAEPGAERSAAPEWIGVKGCRFCPECKGVEWLGHRGDCSRRG